MSASRAWRQVPVTYGEHPRAYRFAGWSLDLTRGLGAPDGACGSTMPNSTCWWFPRPPAHRRAEQLLERARALDEVYDRAIDVQLLRLRQLEIDPESRDCCAERGAGYFRCRCRSGMGMTDFSRCAA